MENLFSSLLATRLLDSQYNNYNKHYDPHRLANYFCDFVSVKKIKDNKVGETQL